MHLIFVPQFFNYHFFSYLGGFVSRTFRIDRTVGEGDDYLFKLPYTTSTSFTGT